MGEYTAVIYIGIILLCRVVQAIFSKKSSNSINGIRVLTGYNAFYMGMSAVLGLGLLLVGGNGFRCDILTVVISVFSGVTLFFSCCCSMFAMKSGTVSLNSMFSTAGMIIPVAAGAILFQKPVGVWQIAGLVLFFVAAWFLVGGSKDIYSNFSVKTLFLLIGSMVANGCTMLAQQMFTAYVPDGDVSVFSFMSFGSIALLSLGLYGIMYAKERNGEKFVATDRGGVKTLAICGVFLAVAVFVINQFATECTKTVSPVILFTLINGGGTIISTVVAAIMYKEKITWKTAVGVGLGIASLIIIKLFEV